MATSAIGNALQAALAMSVIRPTALLAGRDPQ